ncbi:uncharacterized protein LOC128216329 [Mya arenaria]|uniref:uncharacterized protein LOC128216329 n=1 Tax=Mya arenaria TaxID=6604 RepID=UPI0022E143F8|nr:uncharacterized protein LOC128216329 [Mya arenaria]
MAMINGSDDLPPDPENEFVCDACLADDQTEPAMGFCLECNEYLCKPCIDAHRRVRVYKTHQVKKGDEMPRSKTKADRQPVVSKCNLHADKPITAICKTHNQLCCDQCLILAHKVCDDVKSISDVSKEFIGSEDYKTITEKLEYLQIAYTEKMKSAKMNLNEVDVYHKNAIEEFKAEVDKIKQTDIIKLRAIIDTYEHVLSQFMCWVNDIGVHKNAETFEELFILVWRTQHEVANIENNVHKFCTDDSIIRYRFQSDTSMLGRLMEIPYLIKTVNIKHASDSTYCYVADIGMLKENLMLVADYRNSSLKIYNSDTDVLVSSAKLPSKPWQMSVTEEGGAYVTSEGQPKIFHLKSPATDLSTFEEITVDGKCYTVDCFNETLKVQCLSPAKTIEVDGDGKLVRVINNDLSKETTGNGEQFVSTPLWSTQDPATGSMYLSCKSKDSITEITSDDKVKRLVKSDKLNCPYGMCIDTDGTILVCSFKSKDVFRVKRNGDIQSVLPQPLDFNPWTVALDKQTKKLYVGGQSDKLYVFQI